MFRVIAKKVVPVVRAAGKAARPAIRKMATEAEERVVPTATELARTRELFNVVDDRLASSLKGVTDGIARLEAQVVRLEAQVVRLEGRMEAQAVRLETKMDGQVARLDAKMDKFATKEYMKDSIGAMETRIRNYLLVGAGGLIITGATVAARFGFFSPQESKRQDKPVAEQLALLELATAPHPK